MRLLELDCSHLFLLSVSCPLSLLLFSDSFHLTYSFLLSISAYLQDCSSTFSHLMFKISVLALPEATAFHLCIENSWWLQNLKRKLQWKRFAARWTQTWPLMSFQEESWQQPASGREKGERLPRQIASSIRNVDLKSVIHLLVFFPFYSLLL